MKVSCDTVFYQFGADFYDRYKVDQLGNRTRPCCRTSLRQFGFGSATKLDLPMRDDRSDPRPRVEGSSSPSDHPEVLLPDEQSWLPGDDILMSIGQGFVTVTPMQLAVAYSAIANGGRICDLTSSITSRTARGRPGAVGHRALQQARRSRTRRRSSTTSRNALATVPQSGGTAATAFAGFPLSEIPVAGKTGTAQRPPFQDTSWFAAMVPAGDPQYVIVAMVEQGGHGSTSAAPIVRQVIEGLYGIDSTGAGATAG